MSKTARLFQQYGAFLAFAVALTATLGSLSYSEIAHFVPCTLCWYQRILMYPLAIITLVGILQQDEGLPNQVLPFSILGMGVATYHYLTQLGVVSHSATCSVGVPCNLRYVNYFGFVTLPLLSLAAFTLITLIMVAVKWAQSQAEPEQDEQFFSDLADSVPADISSPSFEGK
jgi:disulfide bond formation protein DsbB